MVDAKEEFEIKIVALQAKIEKQNQLKFGGEPKDRTIRVEEIIQCNN